MTDGLQIDYSDLQKTVESLLPDDLPITFEELVKRYHRRVTALGMSFFRNIADTEDFVQDVFIKAYTKLRDFRGESRFSTWLFRIAYTTAVNSIKRRKEYLPLADENLLWDRDYTPEELQIRRLTIETVRDSIKELPQRFALCLDMYFFSIWPTEESGRLRA
jgi:RNA polymerase sigma-70 factor (ECF subfamily)